MASALDTAFALGSARAESVVSEPDSALEAADDSSSGRGRKSQKVSGGQVASQRHVATEQKRRDKINEGYAELQQLLPCTEKVEKARLLMQAAEYTKQLQAAMQQLVDNDATSALPEDLQYAIRKLLPPPRQGKDDGASSGAEHATSAPDSQDPLAILAEHAQQAQATESAEKAAATATSQGVVSSGAPMAMPDLSAMFAAGQAANPLLQLQTFQNNAQLLQQLQLQALAAGQGMLPGLATGVPNLQNLLAIPGAQNLLAGQLNLAAAQTAAAAAAAPAQGTASGGEVDAAAPKRKAANKVRQHSISAKLAKDESPSPGEDEVGRPGGQL